MAANFPPTDCRSTYEPCSSSIALVREWLKGVLIDNHGLRTIVWPMDRKLVRRPRFKKFFKAKFFGCFGSHRLLCRKDRSSCYDPSMPPLVEPADYSEKLIFGLFCLWGGVLQLVSTGSLTRKWEEFGWNQQSRCIEIGGWLERRCLPSCRGLGCDLAGHVSRGKPVCLSGIKESPHTRSRTL